MVDEIIKKYIGHDGRLAVQAGRQGVLVCSGEHPRAELYVLDQHGVPVGCDPTFCPYRALREVHGLVGSLGEFEGLLEKATKGEVGVVRMTRGGRDVKFWFNEASGPF